MVPMASQHRGLEVPPERRERLGQRARLELPVPKEQKARRAWLVA